MQGPVFRGRTKEVSWLLRSLLTCLGVLTFNVTLLRALPLTGGPPQVLRYRDSASGARLMTPATAPGRGRHQSWVETGKWAAESPLPGEPPGPSSVLRYPRASLSSPTLKIITAVRMAVSEY